MEQVSVNIVNVLLNQNTIIQRHLIKRGQFSVRMQRALPLHFVEEDWDWIYIYDAEDELIGKYTGDQLASKSVTVSGDTAKIRLESDDIFSYYGFKITNVSAEFIEGDLNADGKADILDIITLKNILLGESQSFGASADVNNDGLTNSEDLLFLKKYLFANF